MGVDGANVVFVISGNFHQAVRATTVNVFEPRTALNRQAEK